MQLDIKMLYMKINERTYWKHNRQTRPDRRSLEEYVGSNLIFRVNMLKTWLSVVFFIPHSTENTKIWRPISKRLLGT